MTITIALDDPLAAALMDSAKKHHLSVQEFAINILAQAVGDSGAATPEEVVARIQATPPNPSSIRPAMGNLADALGGASEDPHFNLETWTRQWSEVEREMKATSRSNAIAEGCGE